MVSVYVFDEVLLRKSPASDESFWHELTLSLQLTDFTKWNIENLSDLAVCEVFVHSLL